MSLPDGFRRADPDVPHVVSRPRNGNSSARSSSSNGVPRLALSKAEAAEALGVSVDFLEQHILAALRVVRCGRKVLIPLVELERWLRDNAALTLGGTA